MVNKQTSIIVNLDSLEEFKTMGINLSDFVRDKMNEITSDPEIIRNEIDLTKERLENLEDIHKKILEEIKHIEKIAKDEVKVLDEEMIYFIKRTKELMNKSKFPVFKLDIRVSRYNAAFDRKIDVNIIKKMVELI